MIWLTGAGFIAITLVAVAVLRSNPYKRRRDSGEGGGISFGGDGGDGGDCGGGGGD